MVDPPMNVHIYVSIYSTPSVHDTEKEDDGDDDVEMIRQGALYTQFRL